MSTSEQRLNRTTMALEIRSKRKWEKTAPGPPLKAWEHFLFLMGWSPGLRHSSSTMMTSSSHTNTNETLLIGYTSLCWPVCSPCSGWYQLPKLCAGRTLPHTTPITVFLVVEDRQYALLGQNGSLHSSVAYTLPENGTINAPWAGWLCLSCDEQHKHRALCSRGVA